MLKFWVWVLNYRFPDKSVLCCFYGFIRDFLEFPSVKSSKIITAQRIQQDTNYKHEKSVFVRAVFFRFFQIYIFHRCQKTGLKISLKNELRLK